MRARLLPLLLLGVLSVPAVLSAGPDAHVHEVRRGEHLTGIADRYGVQLSELRSWNNLRGDRILVGQRLRIPRQDHEWYVVRRGDTLSEIAERFDLSLSLLRRLNGLKGSRIQPGQRLKVRPSPLDEGVHVVRRGETLGEIAQRYGIRLSELRSLNGIESDRILVGQKLRLRGSSPAVHIVEWGDALWEIARAYGISVRELKEINGLESSRIHPGQELRLRRDEAASQGPPLRSYRVRPGDSMVEIARLHQMSLYELRTLNGLTGSIIHPGQELKVRPILGLDHDDRNWVRLDDIDWDGLRVATASLRPLTAENGPYYHHRPHAPRQRSHGYLEESRAGPLASYRRAKALFTEFEQRVDRLGRLSDRLEGWHVVLDPGHGGIDPGTIVEGVDGNGDTIHVVEDEYVFDIALRIYVLLRLHGAEVTLTLLSPNHLLRQTAPATRTFVHERNEVYNSLELNRKNRPSSWPKGGRAGLNARVQVAREAFRGVPQARRVFLSFHADNSPESPAAVSVFYYQSSTRTDRASRDFAQRLLPHLGAGARTKGRRLQVLRDNPAAVAALVEVRNLAYTDHAWALRHTELRQRDAEKITRSLLEALVPEPAPRTARAR